MHCNIFFPNSISIQKILRIDSGKQWPPTTRCSSPGASQSPPAAGSASPATSLEGQRVMRHGNTVGAAEVGSRCLTHCSFKDFKLPGCCTVRPRVALMQGQRRVQCQCVTPSRPARGRRDRGYVYVCQDKNVRCSPRNNGAFSAKLWLRYFTFLLLYFRSKRKLNYFS